MNNQEIVVQNQLARLMGFQILQNVVNKKQLFDVMDDYIQNHSKVYKRSVSRDELSVKKWRDGFKDNPFFDDLNSLDIQKYVASRIGSGAAPASVNRELAFFKAVVKKAEDWGVNVPKVKVKFFKEKHKLQYFSKEETVKLLTSGFYKSNRRVAHLKTVVMIGIHTGMRRSEILNLKWDQVDFEAKVIRLLETKSGDEQTVSMPDLLITYLESVPKNSPWVITDYRGLHVKDVKNSFKALLKFEGIFKPGYTLHTLRHTFASHLAMAGVSLGVIQDCLRHADISTTMRYAHISDQHKRDSVNKLAEVFH